MIVNRNLSTVAIFVALILVALTGCKRQLDTGYGRSSGTGYWSSVNGTIVFKKILRAEGRKYDQYRRVSPRWERYNTVYWIPDNIDAPGQPAIDKVEEWLNRESDRTLVYVARDYDAAVVYWDKIKEQDSADPDRLKRDHADAVTQYLSSYDGRYGPSSCSWFDWSSNSFRKAKDVTGPMADQVDTSSVDIHYGSLPVPGDVQDSGSFGDYDVEVFMSVDSIPFVYELRKPEWSGSRIIIVGNGSLILNLPLANSENRDLAKTLVQKAEEIEYAQERILIVEQAGKILVSEQENPEHASKWSWITKQPLRYIVPNLIFWCMLFCFVYFPIFGRPRKIARKSTADFRDHIEALSRLISRTKIRQLPQTWIDQYRRNTERKQRMR